MRKTCCFLITQTFPCTNKTDAVVNSDLLAVFVYRRKLVVARLLEGNWPVNEIKLRPVSTRPQKASSAWVHQDNQAQALPESCQGSFQRPLDGESCLGVSS